MEELLAAPHDDTSDKILLGQGRLGLQSGAPRIIENLARVAFLVRPTTSKAGSHGNSY